MRKILPTEIFVISSTSIQNGWHKARGLTRTYEKQPRVPMPEPQITASAFNPMYNLHSPEQMIEHMAAIPWQGAFVQPRTPKKDGPNAYAPGGSLLCGLLR